MFQGYAVMLWVAHVAAKMATEEGPLLFSKLNTDLDVVVCHPMWNAVRTHSVTLCVCYV